MKKILALLLAMMMVFALAACGSNEETPSGSGSNTPGSSQQQEQPGNSDDGDDESGGTPVAAGSYDGPFDDKWPDCVWTRLVPKPEFSEKSKEDSYSAEALVNGFAAAYTDVTMDEAKEYVKAVQAAGFDQSITENGNDTLYYYMAFNEDHVKFELNLNPVLGTTILMK